METVFLETNALNTCLRHNYSGKKLGQILSAKNLTPIISQHTTYELARNFLHDDNRIIGISLFIILRDLNPFYSCQTRELIKREINKLLYDIPCVYIIENKHYSDLKSAIDNICEGKISNEYVDFIEKRESEIKKEKSIWSNLFSKNKIKSFNDFFIEITNKRINIISLVMHLCNKAIDKQQAACLMSKLNESKVLKTAIRTNLYMNYIAIQNSTAPSKDKLDDYRHLIDASICSHFVTNDEKLKNAIPVLIPDLNAMTFEELIS